MIQAPFPPIELATRGGELHGADFGLYELIGQSVRAEILRVLPEGWTFEGKRVLDFGCGAGRTLRHFLEEAEVGRLRHRRSEHRLARVHLSPPLQEFTNEENPLYHSRRNRSP